MSTSLKVIILTVASLLGLLAVAAVTLLLFLDPSAYKPRLEAAATEALRMNVTVGGGMGISFLPGLSVILKDVHIRNRGMDLVSVEEAKLRVGLRYLLRNELRVGKVTLKGAVISVDRNRGGTFNYERPEPTGESPSAMNVANVSISDGILRYTDHASDSGFEARQCNIDVHHLRHAGDAGSEMLKSLSATVEFACGEFQMKDFTAADLKFSAAGTSGVFGLKPITMRVFGAEGSASLQADFSGAVPLYKVHLSLPQFRIEELFKTRSTKKSAEGRMDFSADLSMQGRTMLEMRQTMAGSISLRGQKLTVTGRDLDQEFADFESSQNFSLVDVGAFFFAGPLGLVVTKGYDFANLIQGSSGSSEISVLVSEWKVERGVAQAQDAAMATKENRIALHGGLDFVNETFDDVIIALVDGDGCAKVRQRVLGTFQEPVVEEPGLLKSLAGPAIELLQKGADLVSPGGCDVFYAGSVAPPK